MQISYLIHSGVIAACTLSHRHFTRLTKSLRIYKTQESANAGVLLFVFRRDCIQSERLFNLSCSPEL